MFAMLTDFHAKLYAHELLRRLPSDSIEKFTAALMDSRVDLNPHQVDAALFAFRSPLSKGAILADEVGLGKTIEAGILLSQKWAEKKRRILVILPASLRKQWHQELLEKFYLPSRIMDARAFNAAIKSGERNPFDCPDIVLCSYFFARNKSDCLRALNWDLVVIDEAHRLRNVYKPGNKIARELKSALAHVPKVLLTATPLQNSLLELYGLVSFIDDHAFGDLKSFRTQFARITSDIGFDELKIRLAPVCRRTLRRQVLEYIRYTERKAYTQDFTPTEDEVVLYDMISEYLQRPDLMALPSGQRTLMILVLRKLLASSTFAIAGALATMAHKLKGRILEDERMQSLATVQEDYEAYGELADELGMNEEEPVESLTPKERKKLEQEVQDLQGLHDLAVTITENAKGNALLKALEVGFRTTSELGGAEKAVIFTESRRTQEYLADLLRTNGYVGDIVLFNGTNTDQGARTIFSAWKARHQGSDAITGSRSSDTRAALVEEFRDRARIMIATEAAAEGINLQFCSLVVNYDLPWNPQRIEQRIGRCHRYGQKHDVVVINFLNRDNAADLRVFQLLSEKFKLFDGVFGASDEVLGNIESGVNFEKRIAEIYQTCRTSEEIKNSFDALQKEMETEIGQTMRSTRQKLLEHFDADVAEKLNVYKIETTASLNKYGALLWDTSKHVLHSKADFDERSLTFDLHDTSIPNVEPGRYTLKPGVERGHHYRLQHPLAQWVLNTAAKKELPPVMLVFDYSGTPRHISILEELVGQSGTLCVHGMTVDTLESEDYVLLAAVTDEGQILDAKQARRLFDLPARVEKAHAVDPNNVRNVLEEQKNKILATIAERNAVFFEEEMDKLDRWAEDKRKTLKAVLKKYDDALTVLKKQARSAPNLPQKLAIQKKLRTLNAKRDNAWKEYDKAARNVERDKDALLNEVEARMEQKDHETPLFTIAWRLE